VGMTGGGEGGPKSSVIGSGTRLSMTGKVLNL
jgi:hypothetical protein